MGMWPSTGKTLWWGGDFFFKKRVLDVVQSFFVPRKNGKVLGKWGSLLRNG